MVLVNLAFLEGRIHLVNINLISGLYISPLTSHLSPLTDKPADLSQLTNNVFLLAAFQL